MKTKISLFILVWAFVGFSSAFAATNFGTRAASSADLTSSPSVRTRTNVNYEKYETKTSTKTYDVKDNNTNLYYTQPANRSALYKQYNSTAGSQNIRTIRSETVREQLKRKYYLAHPFFQPLKGKFGSVTDLSYSMNSYDIGLSVSQDFIDSTGVSISDLSAKWNTNQITIKEDFSYGITDTIAVLAMLQYNMSDYKLDWSSAPDDTMDDSGLNLFGIGGQWRFIDNEKWIATLSGYYQHQKDISNNFILDLKGGYKISSSTIYGLARGWLLDFDGNTYGNGMSGATADGTVSSIFIAYDTDVSSVFFAEGGLGLFSVLDEDWTLNFEAVFGYYDWHNQASLKAAVGWQPNDWLALNLYAKTAIYDSADGQKLNFWWLEPGKGLDQWTVAGTANIDNYSETSIGLQAVFLF